jgi:hypothetical protein
LAYAAVGCVSKTENEESTKSGGRRYTMPFTVNECTVTTNSITITFADTVLSGPTDPHGGDNPANYTVYDPAAGFSVPTHPDPTWKIDLSTDKKMVVLTLPKGTGFNPGDYVLVSVSNINSGGTPATLISPASLVRHVPGGTQVGRITRDVEDAISYPVLTEEIGYRPSPVGIPTGGSSGIFGSGGSGLGQVAAKAVSEVLGWKPSTTDPKGFIGALTQAFTLNDVEGHTESTWNPRTYAVQTDLGGGITGAQASLYMRAKNALDSALPLLDGLYPLDPEADPEYVKALREMARSQMTEIVKELGVVGLPSILRIDTYFEILLGQNPRDINQGTSIIFDPDEIGGTLGELREQYGIEFIGNKFNNSVEDEQDITNFRVISDYMTSLMQSWVANRQFFEVKPKQSAFFGTQLVLISRQFNVIAETVNEVRFALDSVFIGPNERQALLLEFDGPFSPMFLEDMLRGIEKLSIEEGPRLLRDGGKISVTNNILPVAKSFRDLIKEAHHPANFGKLPDGFKTARVQHSLDDLQRQITDLIRLIDQIKKDVPKSEDKFEVTDFNVSDSGEGLITVTLFGNGFEPDMEISVHSATATIVDPSQIIFWSAQRVDVDLHTGDYTSESHDLVLTRKDDQSVTVKAVFTGSGSPPQGGYSQAARSNKPPQPTSSGRKAAAPARGKDRKVTIEAGEVVASATPKQGEAGPPPDEIVQVREHIDKLHKGQTELLEGHKDLKGKVEGLQQAVTDKLDAFWEKISNVSGGKNKPQKQT